MEDFRVFDGLDEHDRLLVEVAGELYDGDISSLRSDLDERLNSGRMYIKLQRRLKEDIGRLDRIISLNYPINSYRFVD